MRVALGAQYCASLRNCTGEQLDFRIGFCSIPTLHSTERRPLILAYASPRRLCMLARAASSKYDPTVNDASLAQWADGTLRWAAKGDVTTVAQVRGAEDFSFFAKEVPGLFFFLGASIPSDVSTAAPNHNPGFMIDESTLTVGARALAGLATNYLTSH